MASLTDVMSVMSIVPASALAAGLGDHRRRGRRGVRVNVEAPDVTALLRRAERDRLADAGAGADDRNRLTFEAEQVLHRGLGVLGLGVLGLAIVSSGRGRRECSAGPWLPWRRARSRGPSTSAASAPICVTFGLAGPLAGRQREHGVAVAHACATDRSRARTRRRPSAPCAAPAPSSAARWSRPGRWSCSRRRAARWPVWPVRSSLRASANVPSGLRTPATTWPVSGSMMSPTALTATMAPTLKPLGSVML